MDVPLIIRFPRGDGSNRIRELVYTLDIPATIMSAAKLAGGIDKRVLRDGMSKNAIEVHVMRYADLVAEGGFVPTVDALLRPTTVMGLLCHLKWCTTRQCSSASLHSALVQLLPR